MPHIRTAEGRLCTLYNLRKQKQNTVPNFCVYLRKVEDAIKFIYISKAYEIYVFAKLCLSQYSSFFILARLRCK